MSREFVNIEETRAGVASADYEDVRMSLDLIDRNRDGERDAKLYKQIVSCYRNDKEKFSCTMDGNWNQTLSQYDNHAALMGLSRRKNLQYNSVIFKDDALSFNNSEVRNLETWEETIAVLTDRYNGFIRKRAIINEIRVIHLSKFIAESKHEVEALQVMERRIEKLILQCTSGKNGDEDKRDALYFGVRDFPWVAMPISLLSRSDKKYKLFLDELAAAGQTHRIARGGSGSFRNKATSSKVGGFLGRGSTSRYKTSNEANVWFQGQAKYGRDPRAPKRKELSYKKDLKCYNCGSKEHILLKCAAKTDDERIMQRRIKDLIRNKPKLDQVKNLKQIFKDQSKHVNFLSKELFTNMYEKLSLNHIECSGIEK